MNSSHYPDNRSMTKNTKNMPDDIAALSFEDALSELEGIVKRIEDGKSKLDDAVKAYERGTWLRIHCETKLREAQARIEQISPNIDGSVTLKPFSQ